MAKFRLGDEVKVIAEIDFTSVNRKGDIGIVTEINSCVEDEFNLYRVEVEGRGSESNWEVEEDLELVQAVEEFKEGDVVRILSNNQGSLNPLGSIGMISKVDIDRTARVIVRNYTDKNLQNWHSFDTLELVKDKGSKNSPITSELEPVGREDLVEGVEYYLDEDLNIAKFRHRDVNEGTLYFSSRDKHPYMMNYQGFILFDTKGGPFYKIDSTKKSPITVKKVEGTNLVLGNKYYLDKLMDVLGTYVGEDNLTRHLLFEVKGNTNGYKKNKQGYVYFMTRTGNFFYEIKQ